MYEGLVKSLRWLGFMFPETHPAQDDADRMSNNIHLYCTQAADAIEELTDNNVGKWVPVTERLPEGEVLAVNALQWSFGYQEYLIGYIGEDYDSDTGVLCESDDAILTNVTHWMPLPPPKEDKL